MSFIEAVKQLEKCQNEEEIILLLDQYRRESDREVDPDAYRSVFDLADRRIETLRAMSDLRSRASAAEDMLLACSCLHASLELPDVLDELIHLTSDLLGALISVRIFTSEQDVLHLEKEFWPGALPGRGAPSRPSELAYRAAQTGNITVRQDKRSSAIAQAIAVPMNLSGKPVGVVVIHRAGYPELPVTTLDRLQWVANQAARAVENARLFAKVSQQAYTDALTGLPNRRALDWRLEEETRRSSRYHHCFTLAMLDVNNFKEINDFHGHPAGDLVLQHVIGCLRSNLRETDFFARYGGDEFAIILPETDFLLAQSLMQRLVTVAQDCPVDLPGGISQTISISIGLAAYPEHAISAPALLTVADQALYKMKQEKDDVEWLE